VLSLGISLGVAAASGRSVRARVAQGCSDSYSAQRDPSNPLALPSAPGSNPLNGAKFFVAGPAHGQAAAAIAQLLGIDPLSYPDDYSWAQFQSDLDQGSLHARVQQDPKIANEVHLLEKLASQPEAQRFSLYSQRGGPGAISAQVAKIMCHNLTADPGTIPIISTYFLYQTGYGSHGYCETKRQILLNRPNFQRQINELVAGIGNRPAVMLLELDAIGSSGCMEATGALSAWEADISYEIGKVAALPHVVAYIEGGYSDAGSASYTARVLRAVGVQRIRGFFTNDTHLNWTIDEVNWASEVSRLAGGPHFIVSTSDSGRGPKLNPRPVQQGIEDLCNPPGRGAGPRPTTATGFPKADAFLWVHPPGASSGSCRGGTPSGTFFLHRALEESANANARLGPAPQYPSHPY
jgi:endoglucanase